MWLWEGKQDSVWKGVKVIMKAKYKTREITIVKFGKLFIKVYENNKLIGIMSFGDIARALKKEHEEFIASRKTE